MIELVLVVFLLSIAVIATVAVKVGMKAVDFIDDSRRHYQSLEEGQRELISLLKDSSRSESSGRD